MMKPSRPSLLIIGHGSSESQEAEKAVREHAVTLRQSNRYGSVDVQFLKGKAMEARLPEGEVFLLPFFMSHGYFVSHTIPRLFDLHEGEKKDDLRHILLCDAIGVDPTLSEILERMALEICAEEKYQPEKVTLLLAAHGSAKSKASRDAARLQEDVLRQHSDFRTVVSVFLEEEPTLSNWLQDERVEEGPVIVLGLFAAEGPHATEDVPQQIREGQDGFHRVRGIKPEEVHYAGVVGTRPEVVRLIQQSISRRAGAA